MVCAGLFENDASEVLDDRLAISHISSGDDREQKVSSAQVVAAAFSGRFRP